MARKWPSSNSSATSSRRRQRKKRARSKKPSKPKAKPASETITRPAPGNRGGLFFAHPRPEGMALDYLGGLLGEGLIPAKPGGVPKGSRGVFEEVLGGILFCKSTIDVRPPR